MAKQLDTGVRERFMIFVREHAQRQRLGTQGAGAGDDDPMDLVGYGAGGRDRQTDIRAPCMLAAALPC